MYAVKVNRKFSDWEASTSAQVLLVEALECLLMSGAAGKGAVLGNGTDAASW